MKSHVEKRWGLTHIFINLKTRRAWAYHPKMQLHNPIIIPTRNGLFRIGIQAAKELLKHGKKPRRVSFSVWRFSY